MPVAKRGERGGALLAMLTFGVTAIVVAAMFYFASNAEIIGGSGASDLLGAGAVFETDAEPFADTIADTGPVLLPDSAGRDRDIFLQHLGDDVDTGWYAFAARPPEASRDCSIQWVPDEANPDGGDFSYSCGDERYPANGEGLTQYPATVTDGTLTVDLNAAEREADSADDAEETEE